MPTTLSKGYKLPLNGERSWWQTLIDNWTRVNGHNHDGSNSEKIASENITFSSATIETTDWAAVSGQAGTFRQVITLPTGLTFPLAVMTFYVNSGTGAQVFPEVERINSTTYYVYTNDNTLEMKVVYG